MTTVAIEDAEGVRTIALDRPEALNALSLALAHELRGAVVDADRDPGVRCIVVTGRGQAFCAGGDIREFAENAERIREHIRALTADMHAAIATLLRSAKPVAVAVNGVAAGGGFGLAIAGDVVIAAESARFALAYRRIAAVPDNSTTYLLPRLIGPRRTMELYLMDRVLGAAEAREWGIVTRVVPDADLARETSALARRLADGPAWAMGETKRLLRRSLAADLEGQLDAESRAIATSGETDDFREGIAAFLGKREPRFGRR